MTPELWTHLCYLFGAAFDLDPAEQDAFVQNSTAGDAELCDELQRLLANHDSRNVFLGRELPRQPLLDGLLSNQIWSAGELICQRFRIVKLQGRGGMGEVD